MKQLPTTGIGLMLTTQCGGVVCHVAQAAGFVSPIIATGKRLMIQPLPRGRDYFTHGKHRRWRSGQYRPQPVLRLG